LGFPVQSIALVINFYFERNNRIKKVKIDRLTFEKIDLLFKLMKAKKIPIKYNNNNVLEHVDKMR